MNNLPTHKCEGVDARNNWDTRELSLIIFIGLCGPVALLIVHSYVTQLVGLSVD